MREINFRAWCNKDKRYYYTNGEYIIYENKMCLNEETGITGLPHLNEPEQYTGLKDKNSVKIYEGDIVALDLNHYQIEATVIYRQDLMAFMFDHPKGTESMLGLLKDHVIVIGNIHETTK